MGEYKLFCNLKGVQVKIEVKIIIRVVIGDLENSRLCKPAQKKFDQFFEMITFSKNQFYLVKIIAS